MAITGRFGVEIELNSMDSRDFIKNPLGRGELPSGIERISRIVSDLGFVCQIQDWQYNHNPSSWSCKPDSSCGLELCSPVLDERSRGQLFCVMDAIYGDDSVSVDERCAFHVHIELSDMELSEESASVLAWWLKCEHVFVDFASPLRKNNHYCRPVGLTDMFSADEPVCHKSLFKKLNFKHFSANAFHLFNRRRPTLEFRIGEGTKDSHFADMWTRTLLCFAKAAYAKGMPSDYRWLAPRDVLEFMNLENDLETWFLSRLRSNWCLGSSECFLPKNRRHAVEAYTFFSRDAL